LERDAVDATARETGALTGLRRSFGGKDSKPAGRLLRMSFRGRRSRVVLTPRRWRQVGEGNFTGDGGKQARSPGSAKETVKTIRVRECRVIPVYLWSYPRAFFARDPWVQRAPGIPHALFGRKVLAKLGHISPRDVSVCSRMTRLFEN
jgi:hypothetical protein